MAGPGRRSGGRGARRGSALGASAALAAALRWTAAPAGGSLAPCGTGFAAGVRWAPDARHAARGLGRTRPQRHAFETEAQPASEAAAKALLSALAVAAYPLFLWFKALRAEAQLPEYLAPGATLTSLPIEGGTLTVTSHAASELASELDPRTPKGRLPEWRTLRFQPDGGSLLAELIQSVSRVHVASKDSKQCVLVDYLQLNYAQSFASATLAALEVLEAPVVRSQAGEQPLRILCIGLGAGTVPAFLAKALPHCEVDAVELEPGVVEAATGYMGLEPGPCLRFHVEDGVDFALRAAAAGEAYDAVMIDAFDAVGNVPEALWNDGMGFAQALAKGLLRERGGVVAVNHLPWTDCGPTLQAYGQALRSRGSRSVGFSVVAEGPGNNIAVAMSNPPEAVAAEELGRSLARAAREVNDVLRLPFDMEALSSREIQVW